MHKYILIGSAFVTVLVGILNICSSTFSDIEGYSPGNGVVPNEEAAIKIAEAIWLPIYGEDILDGQKPFVAEYDSKNEYWYVHGTLPPNMLGGVAEIKMKKSNGQIVYLHHGK